MKTGPSFTLYGENKVQGSRVFIVKKLRHYITIIRLKEYYFLFICVVRGVPLDIFRVKCVPWLKTN